MRHHCRPDVTAAGHDIEHSLRQDAIGQFDETHRRQRRVFRRLDHHRIAGTQCRNHVPDGNQQRPVPWRNGTDHPERLAMHFDASHFVVLNDLHRQRQVCRHMRPGNRATDFHAGADAAQTVQRLAAFPGHQCHQLRHVSLKYVADGMHELLPIAVGQGTPGRQGRLRRGHRRIDMRRSGKRHLCEHLAGRGIDDPQHLVAANCPAIDHHWLCLHLLVSSLL
ncbi:hypothetical protein SDC9_162025 [bioreactor metagenome]|uniref:Uncharacterized protein n=1 Tax=bioreactor metagenome TaxID=1076179 RepID=A0A645FJX0_9ZZZZ